MFDVWSQINILWLIFSYQFYHMKKFKNFKTTLDIKMDFLVVMRYSVSLKLNMKKNHFGTQWKLFQWHLLEFFELNSIIVGKDVGP